MATISQTVDNSASKRRLVDELTLWIMKFEQYFTRPNQFFLDFIEQFVDQVMSMCPNTPFPTDQNQYDKLVEMYQDIIAARIGDTIVFTDISWATREQDASNVQNPDLRRILLNISAQKPTNLKELHKGYVNKLY